MEGLSEGLAFGTGCKHFLLGPQPLTSFLFGKEGQERWEGGKIGEKLANSTSEILIMVFRFALMISGIGVYPCVFPCLDGEDPRPSAVMMVSRAAQPDIWLHPCP